MPSKPPDEMTREELIAEIETAMYGLDMISALNNGLAFLRELASRLAAAEEKTERLKMEAQIHAQEAHTQKATVHAIYQAIRKGKGEPGDWHGAQPIVDYITAAEAERDAAREDSARLEALVENHWALCSTPDGHWYVYGAYDHEPIEGSNKPTWRESIDAARRAADDGEG